MSHGKGSHRQYIKPNYLMVDESGVNSLAMGFNANQFNMFVDSTASLYINLMIVDLVHFFLQHLFPPLIRSPIFRCF